MNEKIKHEIAVVESAAMVQPTSAAMERHEPASMLDVIARAAADPTVNVDKLERLMAMQQGVLAEKRRIAFRAALTALEADLPQITKSGQVLHGNTLKHKFAKLEDIDNAIRPICKDHGFAFSFDSKPAPNNSIEFSCAMSHREGHSETRTITLPVDTGPGRSAVQAVGSTTSYAKRYLLGMHLHLVTREEDDDGSGSRKMVTEEQAEKIRAALGEVKGNEARFLNWCAAPTFEEIPAANFARCMAFIDEKRRAMP